MDKYGVTRKLQQSKPVDPEELERQVQQEPGDDDPEELERQIQQSRRRPRRDS